MKTSCSGDQPLAGELSVWDNMVMYLRPNKRRKGDSDYEYWSLVESVRTAKGPRQRVVATIGKLPGLDKEERIGWLVLPTS